MANCPKCGCHLRVIDWKQACPKCGANIVLYDLQERLMKDADKAEVQHYHFQKKLDRLKASFVGSKLAIARIVTSTLPIIPIFLPLLYGSALKPLPETNGNISIITLYNLISKADMGKFKALFGSAEKTAAICLTVSVIALIASVLLVFLHLLLLMFSCAKRGKARNYTLDALTLIGALAFAVSIAVLPQNSFFSGKLAIGAYIYIVLILADVAVDAATFIKGIPIRHAPCFVGGIPIEEYFKMLDDNVPHEEIRAEMYRRLTEQQHEKEEKLAAENAERDAKEAQAAAEKAQATQQKEEAKQSK